MEYRNEGTSVYMGDTLIATFAHESGAKDYVALVTKASEEYLYWQGVRDMARSIESELEEQIEQGVRGESLREWLIEHIDESIDGSARVIYTHKAQQCLLYSSNGPDWHPAHLRLT